MLAAQVSVRLVGCPAEALATLVLVKAAGGLVVKDQNADSEPLP